MPGPFKGKDTRDRFRDSFREDGDNLTRVETGDSLAHDKLDSIIDALDGVGGGEVVSTYSEVSSVASSTLTTVVSYTVPGGKIAFLQYCEASGSNISEFIVTINGASAAKMRTHFGDNLNVNFKFAMQGGRGVELTAGDIILIRAEHGRPTSGDYEGRIQVYEV